MSKVFAALLIVFSTATAGATPRTLVCTLEVQIKGKVIDHQEISHDNVGTLGYTEIYAPNLQQNHSTFLIAEIEDAYDKVRLTMTSPTQMENLPQITMDIATGQSMETSGAIPLFLSDKGDVATYTAECTLSP